MNKEKLVFNFLKNYKYFWNEKNLGVDRKHLLILKTFKKKYKKNLKSIISNYMDWAGQDNGHIPFQFNINSIKYYGIFQSVLFFLRHIKSIIFKYNLKKKHFFDDVSILKKTGAFNELKKTKFHKLNFKTRLYFLEKDISTNYRLNRYAYLSNQIKKFNFFKNKNIAYNWVDIGSYYGGVQYLVKKSFKNLNIFLVDFNHQLLRSYLFLKEIYPNSNHILPDQINEKKLINISNSFVYMPIKKFNNFKNIKFDLVSNFFSFGEMKRKFFNKYLNNKLINNSKNLYLVNRFVSAPFFEKTYDTDLNILDYKLKNFKIDYLDVFPIHNYYTIRRKLFNSYEHRPISSQYFEMVMRKIKS